MPAKRKKAKKAITRRKATRTSTGTFRKSTGGRPTRPTTPPAPIRTESEKRRGQQDDDDE